MDLGDLYITIFFIVYKALSISSFNFNFWNTYNKRMKNFQLLRSYYSNPYKIHCTYYILSILCIQTYYLTERRVKIEWARGQKHSWKTFFCAFTKNRLQRLKMSEEYWNWKKESKTNYVSTYYNAHSILCPRLVLFNFIYS